MFVDHVVRQFHPSVAGAGISANGIAEAFVKTFKRDYPRVHPLPAAATVLQQIAGWFDDYNETHPALRARNDLPQGV